MHDCSDCHAVSERLRRQKKANGQKVRRTVQQARQLAQARRGRQFLALAATVTRTIGPGKFAADMKSALDYARDHGHYRDVKQLMLCITRIAETSCDMIGKG